MTIPFNPPDWLIREYVARKQPAEIATEGIQQGLDTYAQLKAQDDAKKQVALGNYLKLLELDPNLTQTPMGQQLQKQVGGGLGGYQPPSPSTPTTSTAQPAIDQPIAGTTPPQAGALPVTSPIIGHFNSLFGRGKLGEKAQGQIKTGLEMQKLEMGLSPQPVMDKKTALEKGVVPANTMIVEPSSNQGETRTERLGSSLRKELTNSKPYDKFITAKSATDNIQNAVTNPGAYGDLSLLFDSMKTLDPGSVVMVGEQQRFAATGSFPARVANVFNKFIDGETLQPEQRREILRYAKSRLRTAHSIYKNHSDPLMKQAKRIGVDPFEVDPYHDYKIEDDAPVSGKSFIKPGEEAEYEAFKKSMQGGN